MHAPPSTTIERAARLLDRIKLETRWLLVSTRTRDFRIDDHDYAEDRQKLVAAWPAWRRGEIGGLAFYDRVGDGGSLLTHLIEIRRQRARQAVAQ